jgi:5-formyltetrahydrofolate cyclo-ligase
MTKKEARNLVNKCFANLSAKEKKNFDDRILSNFIKFVDTNKYKKIGSYFSLHNEVNTAYLNDYLTKAGIQIFLPKLPKDKNNKKLNFFKYLKTDKFTKNRFGILEPSKNMNPLDINELDLILVPFRAINKNLYRLGFGGGFYDYSLAEINSNKCLGLGYEFQILDEFDIEPHDFKLGSLITPEGYFKNAL